MCVCVFALLFLIKKTTTNQVFSSIMYVYTTKTLVCVQRNKFVVKETSLCAKQTAEWILLLPCMRNKVTATSLGVVVLDIVNVADHQNSKMFLGHGVH